MEFSIDPESLLMYNIFMIPGFISVSRILKSSWKFESDPSLLHNAKGPRIIKQSPNDQTDKIKLPSKFHAK